MNDKIQLIDLKAGCSEYMFMNNKSRMNSIHVLSDKQIVVGNDDGQISIVNFKANTRKFKINRFDSCAKGIQCISQLPDTRIICGSYDGCIKIWDIATKKYEMSIIVHSQSINYIIVLSNNNRNCSIISLSVDVSLKLWI